MFELFPTLVFVHFLFDVCLQTPFISEHKGHSLYVMFVHVFVWTWAICAVISLYSVLSRWIPVFLFVGHWAADRYKIYLIDKDFDENVETIDGLLSDNPDVSSRLRILFYSDQIWHLVQLIIVTIFAR